MTAITDALLDDLAAKSEAATDGPWTPNTEAMEIDQALGQADGNYRIRRAGFIQADELEDLAYIAAASPDVVLALVAEVRALRATVERVRELHRPSVVYAYADECGCGDEDHLIMESLTGDDLCYGTPTGEKFCSECTPECGADELIDWPCDTVRALDGEDPR